MKVSASTVQRKGVSGQIKPQIHYRIRQFAEDHPDASQYPIADAQEAAELLLTIAASIHHGLDYEGDKAVRKAMRATANGMRAAVSRGRQFHYIRELGDQEFFGLKITVPDGFGEA